VAVISQSIACCEHHSVEQRLARWVLTMHEYTHPRELLMSHQNIAAMLGARRSGVSVAANIFRELGLISYRRGRIKVLDKSGLERKSCECYRYIKRQYAGWRDQVPRLLSGDDRPRRPVAARKRRK
jgi:hypothetical protein